MVPDAITAASGGSLLFVSIGLLLFLNRKTEKPKLFLVLLIQMIHQVVRQWSTKMRRLAFLLVWQGTSPREKQPPWGGDQRLRAKISEYLNPYQVLIKPQ
jgi:hypothetical protein